MTDTALRTRPDGPFSLLGLAVVGGTLALDQLAKAIAEAELPYGETIDLLPFLALHRIHNTGVAFSMFSALGGGALIALTVAISLIVLVFWWRAHEGGKLATIGYALIVGGALGNLIDRVIHGYVVDFLLLHAGERTLFVFNLADAALTLGPILLVIVYLVPHRPS